MPLIEELPIAAPQRVSHGWAYVPDTGPIPAMAPPSGARKRNNRQDNNNAAGTTNATATAKLQKSIRQRLESLDRENYRDGVVVPIPARAKDGGAGGTGKKMSNNVRRILTYQRTFQHYLADEQAGMGGGGGGGGGGAGGNAVMGAGSSATQGSSQSTSSRNDARRKSSNMAAAVAAAAVPTTPAGDATPKSTTKRGMRRRESQVTVVAAPSPKDTTITPRRRGPGRPPRSSTSIKPEEDRDTAMTGTETPTREATTTAQDSPAATATTPTSDKQQSSSSSSSSLSHHPTAITSHPPPQQLPPRPLYDPNLDTHPLLQTLDLPRIPTHRILTILLSEPPLSYTAARASETVDPATSSRGKEEAKPPRRPPPPRHFCALCGYWGKIKCRKCGEWTCGLMECWKAHEGVCVAMGMY